MAPKRASSREEGTDERDRQAPGKSLRYGPSELQDTRYLQFLAAAGGSSTNDMELSSSERLIRKVVQDLIPPILAEVIPPILEEVIPPILQRYLSPSRGLSANRQIGTRGGGRSLELCFMNGLPSAIFTQAEITAEDGSPLQIALCDTTFQPRRVKEDAPSMKIQICVLKGEFGSEDWTADEFNDNILSQREGKPPLLHGHTVVTLRNGVGYVKNVVFTDNSSWTKSKTFRIGVKVSQSTSVGADIKEGRSEHLRVKDYRGVSYKKHDRPSLNDKVWRLHKIAKDGTIHEQLFLHGIETVKDLLRLYTTNESSLRQKIGNIPRKSWEKIIDHAKGCEIDDDTRYIYLAAEQSIFLVLDCIYQVLGVSDGQNFCSLESLNSEDQRLVELVKRQAYNNLKDLKPIEPTPHCQQQMFLPYLSQPSTSTTSEHIDEAAPRDQVGSSQLPQLAETQLDWPAGEQLISGGYIGDDIGSQLDQFTFPTTWEPVDDFPYDCGPESSNPLLNAAVYISCRGKCKTVWSKIRNVLKWVMPHAARRKAKVSHFQY